jgi:hypothetical protein
MTPKEHKDTIAAYAIFETPLGQLVKNDLLARAVASNKEGALWLYAMIEAMLVEKAKLTGKRQESVTTEETTEEA